MIISFLSQKGGVGKSSLARTCAVEFTRAGWNVLLADIDSSQITSNRWAEQSRNLANISPHIETTVFTATHQALTQAKNYDLTVIDGAPHATRGTLEAAEHSDLVVLPTGSSLDDLEPSILLANELANSLNSEKIVFALYKTTSAAQERISRETIESYDFSVFDNAIPMKTGYIAAFDSGFCATETKYKKLNELALALVDEIAQRITK